MALYQCEAVLGGCGGTGKVREKGQLCAVCTKVIEGASMQTWRPCPGVLGGCGGTGKVRGNEVLCPKCIASQND